MRSRNTFDYPHTCPKIDKEIERVNDLIQRYLTDFILELSPYVPKDVAMNMAMEWGCDIYRDIQGCFEEVRKTNEDMREEANRQISSLISELDDLNCQIKELEERIEY